MFVSYVVVASLGLLVIWYFAGLADAVKRKATQPVPYYRRVAIGDERNLGNAACATTEQQHQHHETPKSEEIYRLKGGNAKYPAEKTADGEKRQKQLWMKGICTCSSRGKVQVQTN